MTSETAAAQGRGPLQGPAALGRWLREGVRAAVWRQPQWQGLPAGPAWLAGFGLAGLPIVLLLDWLYLPGPGRLDPQAAAEGWLSVLLLAWACRLARRGPAPGGDAEPAPGTAQLICMALLVAHLASLAWGLLSVALLRGGVDGEGRLGAWAPWALWVAPGVWTVLAQWLLLWRDGTRRALPRAVASLALAAAAALPYLLPATPLWQAVDDAPADAPAAEPLALTQDVIEGQAELLARQLQALPRQRPGVVDVYAIGFAPYGEEDVFRRETELVSTVMAQRFDATGRTLQLVNHPQTARALAWATPLNLQRAIRHIATLMDRDEDVLFLHLTSHGARDGELATSLWPLSLEPVTPDDLKAWLDEAGVRWRIVSISACYSGSWIAPLAGDETLVMTAADAEHTSYGCGRLSELTFFGRALYDEQLRRETLSFETAHARARDLIRQREREAGKTDGYSNPQIAMGSAMRARLERLQRQLQEGGAPAGAASR